MPQPTFSHGALAVGLLPAVFGLHALVKPEAVLKSINFPVPTQPESRKLTASLMRIYGIRNVAISYLLTLIWTTGNQRLMATGLVAGLAMTITDGFVSISQIGGGEWNHWGFTPVIAAVQAGLLGYFQGWGF